jgi:NAD(P)-dependent dehydrogenase (short-subunit alcohol dehydrogenase family)
MSTDPLFSVEAQKVLVSGGSRGIGFAMAKAFAERGASVVITGRDATTLDRAIGRIKGSVAYVVADVADFSTIEPAVESAIATLGHIDTLINCAGVNRRKPALEMTEQDYDFVLDINMKGAFFVAKAVGRHMVERKSGSQINIASLNTDRPGLYLSPYAISKAGIGSMTKVLAMEWGPFNVRVNGIAPGFILTELTEKVWTNPAMLEWGLPQHPLGRIGQPEDLISTAIYLASPGAAWMTGQTIYVDGGFTAGWNWPIAEIQDQL